MSSYLGVTLEAGLADAKLEAVLNSGLLCLLLTEPDKGYLRVGEAGSGHTQVVDHMGASGHVLHSRDTL